jgi:hypothetical protein
MIKYSRTVNQKETLPIFVDSLSKYKAITPFSGLTIHGEFVWDSDFVRELK